MSRRCRGQGGHEVRVHVHRARGQGVHRRYAGHQGRGRRRASSTSRPSRARRPNPPQSSRTDLIVTSCVGLAVVAAVGDTGRGDLVQGGQPGLVDGAEHRVGRRQHRVLVHQEELAAVGAQTRVGHRERAPRVQHRRLHRGIGQPELVGRVFVRESVARTARARCRSDRRTAALRASGVVVSRWHVVSSKKPCWARLAKLLTVQGVLPLSNCSPMLPRLVVMLALTSAGSVGTRPVRGGLAGLLAGSVVAGYWQLDPSVAGGLNCGSGPGVGRLGRRCRAVRAAHAVEVFEASAQRDEQHHAQHDHEDGERRDHIADDQARDGKPAALLAGLLDLRQRNVPEHDAQRVRTRTHTPATAIAMAFVGCGYRRSRG